jgi:predicted Zn-dependent protease
MLEIPALTSVDHTSPYYNERGKTGIFYAQSWALVHMLNFAPEYRPGLANFIEMILGGEDAGRSFQQAFGKGPGVVLQDLHAYLHNNRFQGVRFRASKFDVAKVPAQPMPEVESQLALADLLLAIGKVEDARQLYRKLESAHPDSIPVRVALGQFAARTEDYVAARRLFESAIDAGCRNPQLFYDYAMVLRQLNQPDSLIAQNLEQAVTLDDRHFDAHNFLGYMFLRAGRYNDAIVHLKRATELQPGKAPVWENLALAYHKSGNNEQAREAARAGRKVASGPEEAVRMDATIDLIESDADKIL